MKNIGFALLMLGIIIALPAAGCYSYVRALGPEDLWFLGITSGIAGLIFVIIGSKK